MPQRKTRAKPTAKTKAKPKGTTQRKTKGVTKKKRRLADQLPPPRPPRQVEPLSAALQAVIPNRGGKAIVEISPEFDRVVNPVLDFLAGRVVEAVGDQLIEQVFINLDSRVAMFVGTMMAAKMDSSTRWAQLRNKLAEMLASEDTLRQASTQDLLTFAELARRGEKDDRDFVLDGSKFLAEAFNRIPDLVERMRGGAFNTQADADRELVERLTPEQREGMRNILTALSEAVTVARGRDGGTD